jgi:hypothetical protein
MWDLETIKFMNKPKQVDLSKRRANAMNGVAYSATSDSLNPKPVMYIDPNMALISPLKSDAVYIARKISDSSIRKPIHGGRVG